jgi:hypothetical protein
MAHEYLLNYRIVDKDHNYFLTKKSVGDPVESWLLDEPKVMKNIHGIQREYPKGTWIAKTRITDPETMVKAEKGEVAYSVTALSKEKADEYKAAVKERVLIKDLDDPVGFTLSLVSNPCVDNSCSVKNDEKEDDNINQDNFIQKFMTALKSAFEDEADNNGGDNMADNNSEKDGTDKSNKSDEYVTKSDFETFKNEILEAIKGEKDESTNSEENSKDGDKSEKEDETGKNEPGSKAVKNHDDNKPEASFKSIEHYMGRNKRGRPIKRDE